MLSPMDAFSRLKKDGVFLETADNIQWYWHSVGGGFKCMASRNLNGNGAPTVYREFHVAEPPSLRKVYF